MPAAPPGRRFLCSARNYRAPVDGRIIHVHSKAFEDIGGHVTKGFDERNILRHQAGDRLSRIATFRKQTLGGIEVARTFENFAAFLIVERRTRGEETAHRLP